jgi:hypothetical protein
MMHELLAAFIPLFVSIDAFGLVPMFLSLTEGMDDKVRRQVTFEAVSFALAICLGFMLLGNAMFDALGISQADFKIAGGILLLVLAIIDLLIRGKPAVDENVAIGIFPLAMPLIAGPGVEFHHSDSGAALFKPPFAFAGTQRDAGSEQAGHGPARRHRGAPDPNGDRAGVDAELALTHRDRTFSDRLIRQASPFCLPPEPCRR